MERLTLNLVEINKIMKQLLIFVLLLTFNKTIFSQEIKTDSLLTEKQNAEWITEFEKLDSKSKQITEIKKKILSDSIYSKKNGHYRIGCRIIVKNGETIESARKRANCECKILFVLNFKRTGYLLDVSEYPKTVKRLDLINSKNINKIKVIKGIAASTLYGIDGRCGVVVLFSDDRKFKRKIKNVL